MSSYESETEEEVVQVVGEGISLEARFSYKC